MIFGKFKENNPLILILLPIIVAVFFVPTIITDSNINFVKQEYFLSHYYLVPKWVLASISAVAILLAAILVGVFVNRNEFYQKNTYLAPIFYVIISSLPVRNIFEPKIHLANLLVLAALFPLLKLINEENWRDHSFKAGFYLGLAYLVDQSMALFFIPFFLGLFASNALKFRTIILYLVGLSISLIYKTAYHIIFDKKILFEFYFKKKVGNFIFSEENWLEFSFYGWLVLLILIGILGVLSFQFVSIKFKQKIKILITVLITSAITFAITYLFKLGNYSNVGALSSLIVLLTTLSSLSPKVKHLSDFSMLLGVALYVLTFFF